MQRLVSGTSDGSSLAAGKLEWHGYKHKIIMEQIEYSEEIRAQLGLEMGFPPPPDIDNEVGINNSNESVK